MRLSFKKSALLFTTVALGGMLGANAQDLVLEGYQDAYTFEQDWKNENVPTSSGVLFTDYRQGFGQNNQFYIQNKNASGKKIEIYDQNGYVGYFAESGLGSNITKDEAGNIIVRTGQYARPYTRDKNFRIIKADGSQSIDLTLPSDCSVARGDYWGFANGDVFSAQGGKFAFSGSNHNYFYLVEIKSGQVVSGTKVMLPYLFGLNADMYFSSDGIVNSWKDANGNQHYLAINSNENPIDIVLDENNNATATTIAMKSFTSYGTCTGANCFAFNGKNYIMFSTQPNWNDGFVIAELGTNDDGTLNGAISVVAQHVNDYTTPMGDNVSSKCDWLNWEPRDSKSIYVYQYFPGYYMARYIFGIKTDDTPLVDIVNDGTVGQTYTVADDIMGVYIAEKEPTRVYAKDYGKHRYPSTIKDGEVDFVKDQVDENEIKLQQDDWDQSNWVILDFETAEEAQKFAGKIGETNQTSPIACKVIKGGTLTGKLTNKLNPTMTVTSYVEPTETLDYLQNSYIPCNFMTPNVQSNIYWHGETHDYFFIEPKPQEYVKVWWALYDANNHFTIDTDSKFKGSFKADRSLYPGVWEQDFKIGKAYNFHAIVRYVASSKDDPFEGNYMVFPLEGGAGIITGISNITSDAQVAGVTYVNMLGMESTTPYAGLNIVVKRYSNGNLVVTKEFIR